jgi:hypothetical protein
VVDFLRLCSLSRRGYRTFESCSAPADYKAEVTLSGGKRFPLYFCNEHMAKAFQIAQIEAACRCPNAKLATTVKSLSFRFIVRGTTSAASASDTGKTA